MNAVLEPTLFAAAGASPTRVTYSELQRAYDHFNARLFGGQLPGCLITLQREKRTCWYFSAARFASLDGGTTDEIAMNPTYFAAVPLIETMQTMVHEMCHLWQHHFGTPGRGRYHNEEWAARMEAVGLMPSSTGQPGGKRTGDMMADYSLPDGRFLAACSELLTSSFQLSWYDRFPAEDHVRLGQQVASASHLSGLAGSRPPMETAPALAGVVRPVRGASGSGADGDGAAPANKSNRLKYTCSRCLASVWGKPGLKILCGVCRAEFSAL